MLIVFVANIARHISPMCAMDEYATSRFISSCFIARSEAYTIPITASVDTVSPHAQDPVGITGTSHLSTPNTPIFTITPLSIMVTAVGDCSYVSGCQVCNGNTGIFTANATNITQNNHSCSGLVSRTL